MSSLGVLFRSSELYRAVLTASLFDAVNENHQSIAREPSWNCDLSFFNRRPDLGPLFLMVNMELNELAK
jgi:hypothetical protein